MKEETRRINELLSDWFRQIGLKLIDFKLEFGFDKDGKIILADEFSPDNCRLWDAEGHHMDKDVFRRGLGELALETPIVEFYYKNDDLDDPFINDEHVKFLKIASDEEIAFLKEETRRINELLSDWFRQIGLKLIDFKLEFGF
ncbi:hypothetical protein GR255_25405, partial [Mycobacterium tuberculosis]|nr:hypothetical protein [Mycobacterium tuberculosis]